MSMLFEMNPLLHLIIDIVGSVGSILLCGLAIVAAAAWVIKKFWKPIVVSVILMMICVGVYLYLAANGFGL